ncbi:ElaB/YqjD/DUF883 family membrane-anchored ribosome-binding protein [Pseudochelatococcus lubricantis]|uniref:ElaB/YqjD/DUF883 family membrane-anchored ribosome-binding protein n=1 Tax=Pseudochelatococcus lubricantis TaxID=1538102 RepID=A0ABX0UWL3_9HYPH|nr:DUF883 family protein [Pseudochelatococcus lubricantis]NIJ57147.1 ElaB/YqjD/DUF883 family membrane-anchored ribosome-binding protein [Pseudochelatococcus lubricantis]
MADKTENAFNAEIETLRTDIRGLADSVAELVRRETENARVGVKDAADSLAQTVSATTESVSQAGHRLAADAQDSVRTATTKVEACIEKNPLQSVLVAAGVGFVLGLLSRRG